MERFIEYYQTKSTFTKTIDHLTGVRFVEASSITFKSVFYYKNNDTFYIADIDFLYDPSEENGTKLLKLTYAVKTNNIDGIQDKKEIY